MPDGQQSAQRRDTAYHSDTISTLENRVSVRSFTSQPVTDEAVEKILRAAFRAPTSSNIQAYSVIVVRDPDILKPLSVVTSNQKHVAEAPVFLAFCADLTRMEEALERNGKAFGETNLEMGLVSSIDAALVGMSAYLVAESIGLRGVMIGAVRNNAVETARILGLPRGVYCVFGMVLGWPAEAPRQKPRMDYDAMVHYEQYGRLHGERSASEALDGYDAALAAHYTAIGKETTPDSWTHDLAKKFSPQRREKLREQLKEQGFDFR